MNTINPQRINGREASRYLGVSHTRFYEHVAAGRIRKTTYPGEIVGKYSVKELDRFIAENTEGTHE